MSIKQLITNEQTQLMRQRVALKKQLLESTPAGELANYSSNLEYVEVREQLNTAMGILADIQNLEKERKAEISDADQIAILKKNLRQLEDHHKLLVEQKRDTTAVDYKIAFVQKFLPKIKTEDETRFDIQQLIDEGANNMGQIMSILRNSGEYDLKLAQGIAKELL